MAAFKHFPEHGKCVVCQTNEDKECLLIPIAGTQQGNIAEAKPVHVDCMGKGFYYPNMNAIVIEVKE